jgi:hypothetical protein
MNMCRFCSTTDLGKKDFNFSCKIYHTKVYTTFTKVVVLFTRKLKKLVSHFSQFFVNFYEFYNSGQSTQKREESNYKEIPGNFQIFTRMPSVCTKDLRKKPGLAMWPLGHGGGATR